MTLLASHIAEDHVTIVTDTATSGPGARKISRGTKAVYLPHAHAVIAGSGWGRVSTALTAWASTTDVRDVDDLAAAAEEVLPHLFAPVLDYPDVDDTDSTVQLAGWSTERDEPMSWSIHLGGPGSAWARTSFHGRRLPTARFEIGSPANSRDRRPEDPPTTDDGWVDLALAVRRHQAAGDRAVVVGGDLVLTRLEREGCTQRRIHRFDDTSIEYLEMVEAARSNHANLVS